MSSIVYLVPERMNKEIPVWEGSSKTILRFMVFGILSIVMQSSSPKSSDMSDYYCTTCLFIPRFFNYNYIKNQRAII